MYTSKRLWLKQDKKAFEEWSELLAVNGLSNKEPLTYTIGIYDKQRLIATISLDHNIIKCASIHPDYQADNLLGTLVTQILEIARSQEYRHVFVYTKIESRKYFQSLGFKEIMSQDSLSFMELGSPDFNDYLDALEQESDEQIEDNAAIVMNANPFTKGHQYLISYAAGRHEQVYVFVLSEDRSEIKTQDRMEMVRLGVQLFENVIVLPTRNYIVSQATFPTYFLKDKAELNIAHTHAQLDAKLFSDYIAPVLNIHTRYVGEEPYSPVTEVYNQSMKQVFKNKIHLEIIPRLSFDEEAISATKVRQAIKENNIEHVRDMVPDTTLDYLIEHNYINKGERL